MTRRRAAAAMAGVTAALWPLAASAADAELGALDAATMAAALATAVAVLVAAILYGARRRPVGPALGDAGEAGEAETRLALAAFEADLRAAIADLGQPPAPVASVRRKAATVDPLRLMLETSSAARRALAIARAGGLPPMPAPAPAPRPARAIAIGTAPKPATMPTSAPTLAHKSAGIAHVIGAIARRPHPRDPRAPARG